MRTSGFTGWCLDGVRGWSMWGLMQPCRWDMTCHLPLGAAGVLPLTHSILWHSPDKDLSWNIFTSVLSAWPFLLPRVLLPQQFLEEVQHSYELNKRWRIHLRIALDQTLWSDMYEFGFQLPALALSLDLKFFTCEGKFSVIKPPFIFLFFLFYCFPLLHFSHEPQCVS